MLTWIIISCVFYLCGYCLSFYMYMDDNFFKPIWCYVLSIVWPIATIISFFVSIQEIIVKKWEK